MHGVFLLGRPHQHHGRTRFLPASSIPIHTTDPKRPSFQEDGNPPIAVIPAKAGIPQHRIVIPTLDVFITH